MQSVNSTLLSRLRGTDGAAVRLPAETVEFYASSYVPSSLTGFNPSDAIEKFSSISLTWNSIAYRREVVSRGEIQKNIGSQTNTVSLNFSNISRYLATWAQTTQIEGLWCVIRYVERDITSDSVVLFIGRAGKPSTINNRSFSLSISTDFGNLNQEIPPFTFSADDPQGRDPSDPLFEGIRYQAIGGSFVYPVVVPAHHFIARIFGQRDTDLIGKQWSSADATPYGNPIREILGRAQVELIPFMWADRGYVLMYNMAACRGPIDSISDIKSRTSGFSDPEESFSTPPAPPEIHLGDTGGTGTNATGWIEFPNAGVFSHLAGISAVSTGSSPDVEDEPPTVTAIVKGRLVPLPDSNGVYTKSFTVVAATNVFTSNSHGFADGTKVMFSGTLPDPLLEDTIYYIRDSATNTFKVSLSSGGSAVDITVDGLGYFFKVGWTDNNTHLARWVFTYLLGIHPGLMGDVQNYLTSQWCDSPLLDESNGELIYLPTVDSAAVNRYVSTGVLDSRYARFYLLGDFGPDDPIPTPSDPIPFDPLNPPTTFTTQKLYRRRYTFNSPINEKVKAMDFLYKNLYPTFRGFHLINSKGQIEIKSEKAADNCLLRSDISAGATSIPVDDVTQFTVGNRLHLGFSLTTSENRTITAKVFTALADAITLTSSGTGITATASGATLSGGSTSVQSSGTVTISGTPNAGDSITITIQGIAVTYTLDADSTLNSCAVMLAEIINANPSLNRFIQATYSGAVITIKAKWGSLTVSALANNHTGPKADPTSPPSPTASSGTMAAGVYKLAYSHLNDLGETLISQIASITLTANQKIDLPLMALPAGFTSRNWYMSESPGATKLIYIANNTGAAFSITALPSKNNAGIPPYNSTGEEGLKIALAFSSNSQGSTVLAQSGLTRANITPDSYNWPLGSEQSSINRIKGKFRDAKNDFALTEFEVNDYAHQRAIGNKVNTLEVDFSGVDNWHQAYRLAQNLLAKYRDCDWFNSLETGTGEAILLEEGDLITSSDDSGGHINVVTRLESFSIGPPEQMWRVKVSKARKYFTAAHSDDVRQHSIPLPTVNRYFQTVNTQLLILDLPVWRELDYPTENFFQVAFARSPDAGDWRDTTLWANYTGDYKAITDATSLQATIGDASTVLGDTSNVYTFDNISTVRVQLSTPGATLSDCTTTEAQNGKNLCAIGSDTNGYELLNFTTAALVGGTDDTYDLSGFLRGRFGTEHLVGTHTNTDKFCLLDENVISVPIDLAYLNREYSYKAQTKNEDLADSTTENFTWTGRSRQAYSPSVIVPALRDSEGDVLIEPFGRNRKGGGVRSFQAGAIGEEEEVYKAQILDGSGGTTLPSGDERILTFRPGLSIAAFLESESGFSGVTHNTFASFPDISTARTMQEIKEEGNYIEANLEIDMTGGSFVAFGLQYKDRPWAGLTSALLTDKSSGGFTGTLDVAAQIPYWVILEAFGPSLGPFYQRLHVYEYGTRIFLATNKSGDPGYDAGFGWSEPTTNAGLFRIQFSFIGSSVVVKKTHTANVPLTKIVTGSVGGIFDVPMFGVAANPGDGPAYRISNMFMTCKPFAKTIYPEAHQVEDFGSVQNPVQMDVWQWSSVTGDGVKKRVLL